MSSLLENCPICDSERVKYRWTAEDAQGNTWRYDACPDCGTIFLNPPLEASELGKFYDDFYYGPGHRRFKGEVEGMVPVFRRFRAKRVERLIPQGGAVLDVGCGRGVFLDILAKKGFRCLGTERSAPAAQNASKRIKVMVGDIENLALPAESFDLVTFWQVLEHLNNPKAAIAETHRILKSGGRMLLQVPNPESLQARASGPYWFHLDPPRHLHLFGLQCLDEMCARFGFVREKVSHLSFEYGPFGALQSFWNILGMRRDLLYNWMMAADKSEIPPSAAARAVLIAASAISAPIATLFSIVEATSQGGIIEVVYRKKPLE